MLLELVHLLVSSASAPGPTVRVGQRSRLDLRRTRSLTELAELTGARSEREAYIRAKREWSALYDSTERVLSSVGIPGDRVEIGGVEFHVHGVTHADTTAEREYLREHVSDYLDRDATVFCEQGLRPMYFDGMDVEEMDDYQWATQQMPVADRQSNSQDIPQFAALDAGVDALRSTVRKRAFSLLDSAGTRWFSSGTAALGRILSGCLQRPEDAATGTTFEGFQKSRTAAREPARLDALQDYYWQTLLHSPIEREWLRRHDPHLELVTHARNERMADYAVYHNTGPGTVHLVVGAAHQPGIVYYLKRHRDGQRSLDQFDLL